MSGKILRLLAFYGFGAAIAYGLKDYYSQAGAEDLMWVLGPTTWLAEHLGGFPFEWEARSGWVSHAHRMIVGPSCAGLNFLIIAFSTYYFTLVHRLRKTGARGAWLVASLGVAGLMTIVTNALRIILAVRLHELDIYGGWVTPERMHRALGALVYCLALVLTYPTIERIVNRFSSTRSEPWRYSALVPMGWYMAIAIGIPILTRAYSQSPAAFLEHSAWVASVCMLVGAAGVCLWLAIARMTRPELEAGGAGPHCS